MTSLFVSPQFPPIFLPTLAYIFGIICQRFNLSFFVIILSIICLSVSFFLFKRNVIKLDFIFWLILISFFLLGIFRYFYIKYNYLSKLQIVNGKNVNINGYVVDKDSLNKFKKNITVQTTEIVNNNKKINLKSNIKIFLRKRHKVKVGDQIEIKNLTVKSTNNSNYEKFLLRDNIIASIFIYKQDITILVRPYFSLKRFIWQVKQRIAKRLKEKINKKTYLLVSSIFLGQKNGDAELFSDLKKEFNCWGIAHYLARSGLHIALIIAIWNLIFKLLPIPFIIKQLILSCLIIIYSLLSWSSISFYRAFLTFIFYKFYNIKFIPIHSTHTLILVCFLVLLINPIQLFFIDFQLSFFLTFILCIFNDLTYYVKKTNLIKNY